MQRDNPDLACTARIKGAWSRIVDEQLARHVVAIFVVPETQGGEVIAYVDTPIAAADLNMQVNSLKLKLNIELASSDASVGQDLEPIRKLKFVVSKEKYVKRARGQEGPIDDLQEDPIERVPLSEQEISELADSVVGISDERLRDTIFSAAKANLEWQKGMHAGE